MTAGPENDNTMYPADPVRPGKPGLRAAWPGSRRAIIIAAVAGAGLLAGAGVAFAATGSPAHPVRPGTITAATPSPSPSPSAPAAKLPPGSHRFPFKFRPPFGPGGFPFGPGGFGFGPGGPLGAGGPFGAIHGQYVTPKSGGGYQTVDVQTGKVTAVSSTSITLRSADGYTHSYTVTGSTVVDAQRGGISSIKTGNEASVQATVSGSTATAASIQDLTLLKQGAHNFGGFPGPRSKMANP
jgi:hypothetical protein